MQGFQTKAKNNRKTTHRRSNGKLVIVRHRQYPSKPKPCKEELESGMTITVQRKKHVDHESVPFWHKPLKNANAPFKGNTAPYATSTKYGTRSEYDKQIELAAVRAAEVFAAREKIRRQKEMEKELEKESIKHEKEDAKNKGGDLS